MSQRCLLETPLLETDKGSLKNPMTKIYDGAPYFKTKNDYKKAKVTGRTDVASTELSYQWQKIRSYQEIPNEGGRQKSLTLRLEMNQTGILKVSSMHLRRRRQADTDLR